MSFSDDSPAAGSGRTGGAAGPGRPGWNGPRPVIALLVIQIVCALIFLWDVANDLHEASPNFFVDLHLLPELLAVLGLGLSILFVGLVLKRMLARQAQLEKGISVASGALSGLIDSYFATWGLTGAEADVATFTIKGYSIAEIANLRGSAEGTIKTHLNAIYRKAGVSGRAQLTSLLVEDLMRAPLVGGAEPEPHAGRY